MSRAFFFPVHYRMSDRARWKGQRKYCVKEAEGEEGEGLKEAVPESTGRTAEHSFLAGSGTEGRSADFPEGSGEEEVQEEVCPDRKTPIVP
jgi:hypothetical protein